MQRLAPKPALVLTLALTFALAGCTGEAPSNEPASPDHPEREAPGLEAPRLKALKEAGRLPPATRGYLVISFDTLRADHLGVYGYERDTSPFFDELAARGTVFDNAVVQYPSTLTSHMSMFTGLYPAEHRVFPPDAVLAPEIETFPEVFQRAGFKTAGHSEGGFVRGRFGFRRGFDEFRARDRQDALQIERTFERGVRFLETLAPDDRFLLFLHTYAVHAPYEPPEGYEDLFWDRAAPETFPPTGPQLVRVNAEQAQLPAEVLEYFRALYDATIRHADDTLRWLFAELERLGLTDEVTVILTSDHGEEFQEHGRMNHTQLYQEVMRVPLVVIHPDVGPGRYQPLVESVDLAPTLYDLARLEPAEEARLPGASLARVLGRTVQAGDEIGRTEAYAEEGGRHRALWRQDGDRLLHLLTFEPAVNDWIPRRLPVTIDRDELNFEARSFEGTQTLTLEARDGVGMSPVAAVPIGPEWTPVRAELPPLPEGQVKWRATLRGERCTVPEEIQALRRWRCEGFQVRGLPRQRVELYDLLSDPEEQKDLSVLREAPTRSLLRVLRDRVFLPRAAAIQETLDEEAERDLRALGYLQ